MEQVEKTNFEFWLINIEGYFLHGHGIFTNNLLTSNEKLQNLTFL